MDTRFQFHFTMVIRAQNYWVSGCVLVSDTQKMVTETQFLDQGFRLGGLNLGSICSLACDIELPGLEITIKIWVSTRKTCLSN